MRLATSREVYLQLGVLEAQLGQRNTSFGDCKIGRFGHRHPRATHKVPVALSLMAREASLAPGLPGRHCQQVAQGRHAEAWGRAASNDGQIETSQLLLIAAATCPMLRVHSSLEMVPDATNTENLQWMAS
jgi:hypothetical protein